MKKYIPIKGFENLYEISKDGEVVSLYFGKRKVLKQGMMTSGYRFVNIKKNGKQFNVSVHRLIAIHFIPNPNNLKQVNHKDGNKLNNHVDNLEWCTQAENIQHMYNSGLKKYKPLHYKGKFGFDHNKSKSVRCVETGEVFGSMSEAERKLNIGQGGVSWSIKHKRPIFGLHFEAAN